MSKIKSARALTKAAARAASMADCLSCVVLRKKAFNKADALLNKAGAVLPSRLR